MEIFEASLWVYQFVPVKYQCCLQVSHGDIFKGPSKDGQLSRRKTVERARALGSGFVWIEAEVDEIA